MDYVEILKGFDSKTVAFLRSKERALFELFLSTYKYIRDTFPNSDCYVNFSPHSGYRQLCLGVKKPESAKGKPVFFMDLTNNDVNFWRNENLFGERQYIQVKSGFGELQQYLDDSFKLLPDLKLRMSGEGLSPIQARLSETSNNEQLRIWKVSHSPKYISDEIREWLVNKHYITVHRNSGNGSAACFEKMSKGDVVSLGCGNAVFKLVRVTSEIISDPESPLSEGWKFRRYQEIKGFPKPIKYKGAHKRWSPRYPGTCWGVPRKEFLFFEKEILLPYFRLNLASLGVDLAQENSVMTDIKNSDSPLNQILYGPPGTGKTYSTINKALEIIEPELLEENQDIQDNPEVRKSLKDRFDKLVKERRIGFVTFHQSFSYEDFVEGIKANTDEHGMVSYVIEDGIFKQMCKQASTSSEDRGLLDSFEGALQSLQERCEELEERITLETVRGKKFEIEYSGEKTFRVFPHSTENTDPNYVASIDNVRKLYLTGSKDGIYNTSYVEGMLVYLKKEFGLKDVPSTPSKSESKKLPFVLIIDEINRGNISNIFGELITLIEPNKRASGTEVLELTLPYSKERFSVPGNLHLIGTMNTADKSLAQVDIALRRRFEFVEMMPSYDVLANVPDIEGVNIAKLLETVNQRIELLYDREHVIGHSFFLPLVDDPSLNKLAEIFTLQIFPLLEEYFFEDWKRVGMVLGDHLKKDKSLMFFQKKFKREDISKLMGDNYDHGGGESYVRNLVALEKPEAFKGIYERIS